MKHKIIPIFLATGLIISAGAITIVSCARKQQEKPITPEVQNPQKPNQSNSSINQKQQADTNEKVVKKITEQISSQSKEKSSVKPDLLFQHNPTTQSETKEQPKVEANFEKHTKINTDSSTQNNKQNQTKKELQKNNNPSVNQENPQPSIPQSNNKQNTNESPSDSNIQATPKNTEQSNNSTQLEPSLDAIPQVVETLWIQGVNVDPSKFTTPQDPELEQMREYPLLNSENEGWYDINKRFAEGDDYLCTAIVATNMLHWWLDINKDYINRFLTDPTKGTIRAGNESITLNDLNAVYHDENKYPDRSKIFDFFNKMFDAEYTWADKLIDMFINGYRYVSVPNRNNPMKYAPSATRGFFQDVFHEKLLTDIHSLNNIDQFSKLVKDSINNKKAMGLVFNMTSTYAHIVNVWGADFDANNRIVALYISDGDDKGNTMNYNDKSQAVGLKRLLIHYNENGTNMRISSYKKDKNTGKIHGKRVLYLYTLDSGAAEWEMYFTRQNKPNNQ
ncbi:IdeS/Mac family cysteine endopeptidase [Ureaplasma sp. ES3154-GEN]|uniref:IdeS/Mac family cysteine endopeptidase n=1 Tax=Ureaplasma sp. ES3154-GEN TaxID=2984844 RepID=UPI0021E9124D|nr:IdeS/Mac family cysteine endopeptidase [Ureaplasma sp. ES3154-GEN]MCV3743457.1 IdeS/Mac family cysteine endopeptidase [Ureaplasma sp. ES3154-GEN]